MGRGYQNKSSSDKRRKAYRAAGLVRKATTLLRARTAGVTSTPLATRGFAGSYRQYGRPVPELKFVDVTATNQAIQNTWTVVLINGAAQGTDFNQRIGRQVCDKSVLLNGIVYNTIATSNPQGVGFRICLIWDYQPNSAAGVPTGTDIFVSNSVVSPMNLNNRDRFKVLYDKKSQMGAFNVTAGAITAGAPQNVFVSKYKKMFNEVIFSGTAATIGSIATGALYLVYITDVNLSCAWDYYTRVRFQDK